MSYQNDEDSSQIFCNKCHSHLKKSTILKLSCNHYLCNSCLSRELLLNKFTSVIQSSGKVTINCSCGFGTKDLSLDSLNKSLETLDQPKVQKLCKKHNSPSTNYCNDCKLWLCEECLKDFHDDYFKGTHEVIKGEQTKNSKCFFHKNYIKDHICKDCNELICALCVTDENSKHVNHSTFTIKGYKKSVRDKKNELKYKTFNELENFLVNKETEIFKVFNDEANKYKKLVDKGIGILINLRDNYVKKNESYIKIMELKFKIIRQAYMNFYEILEDDKANMETFDFLDKIQDEIQNITFNSSKIFNDLSKAVDNLPNFNLEDDSNEQYNNNSLGKSKLKSEGSLVDNNMNLYTMSLSFRKKNYRKITGFETPYSITTICHFYPNSTIIVGTSKGKILIYKDKDVPSKDECTELDEHKESVNVIHQLIHQENECFISASTDKKIVIWQFDGETNSGNKTIFKLKQLNVLENNDIGKVSLLDLCEVYDGKIATTYSDNTLQIWDPKSSSKKEGNEDKLILRNKANYELCIIQLDMNLLISGSRDGRCKLWNLAEKRISRFFVGHKGYVNCLTKINDNKFASGGSDTRIIIWNTEIENHKILLGHTGTIQAICTLNINKIISSSNDKTVKIWDINDLACSYTFRNYHSSTIYGLAVLNNKFVSGGNDKKLIFFDILDKGKSEEKENNKEEYNF